MHLAHGAPPEEYNRHVGRKTMAVTGGLILLLFALAGSVSLGAVPMSIADVFRTLAGAAESRRFSLIVWNIRLPQAVCAAVSGAALAVAGAVMQSVLRNPLGSPFTLGISHAAAFGAAFSVMILGAGSMQSSTAGAVHVANPYAATFWAFAFSMAATGVIVAISRTRGATPEVMVLAGVALGALFTAATMFLQYFADDVQLAAMVFWTFGDVARAGWRELGIISAVLAVCLVYFFAHRWSYNAIDAGDETALALGVRVGRVRLLGMCLASLLTAVVVAFLGVIGFVGLVCPHMVRRVLGSDHRFLLPASAVTGALLLLCADTVARLVLLPHVLPVSVLTAFLGAPVFLYLLITGGRR